MKALLKTACVLALGMNAVAFAAENAQLEEKKQEMPVEQQAQDNAKKDAAAPEMNQAQPEQAGAADAKEAAQEQQEMKK